MKLLMCKNCLRICQFDDVCGADDKRLDHWTRLNRIVAIAASPQSASAGSGAAASTALATSTALASRPRKRRLAASEADSTLDSMEKEHEELTRVKNIQIVQLGRWEIDCWYYSPYPDDFAGDRLFLCEYTLRYFRRRSTLEKHMSACTERSPPGVEIYRDSSRSVSAFEVDGREHKEYCQNLCLLAKLFLDHKTLYFDVDPFLFYVLCETDASGAHVVGYFSKEKVSPVGFNLSCILTLPPYQRKGYGTFLISLSYELSRREGKIGSPERPLSDLGHASYRSYWATAVLHTLVSNSSTGLTLRELSDITAIRMEDILTTLQELGLVKFWRGEHVVSITQAAVDRYVTGSKALQAICKPALLRWRPETPKSKLAPLPQAATASSSSSSASAAAASSVSGFSLAPGTRVGRGRRRGR